jgi:hypothetical protein
MIALVLYHNYSFQNNIKLVYIKTVILNIIALVSYIQTIALNLILFNLHSNYSYQNNT